MTDAANENKIEGLPVKGYRAQDPKAVELVNVHKEIEERMLRVIDNLYLSPDIDMRWLAIGRTHLQQAFMAINRAVFQPERVRLDTDPQEGPGIPGEAV